MSQTSHPSKRYLRWLSRQSKQPAFVIPPPGDVIPIPRLSIPGNVCSHCGAVIGASLVCPGCGWVDPLTRPAVSSEEGQ